MEENKHENNPRFLNRTGFTLVETMIAISLFLVIAMSAYWSFRSGFTAYQRIESQLGGDYEMKMFIRQLNEELRNAIYYAESPFEGEADRLIFPCRLKRYNAKEMEENLYLVSYYFRSKTLERTEEKLRKSFKDQETVKEPVLNFSSCRFQFAYKRRDGGIEWKNEWSKNPYLGIPRAIRLTTKPQKVKKGEEENTIQFLIPHGTLGFVT